jgi:outer membrane murein-binding lipoprotein Lpp
VKSVPVWIWYTALRILLFAVPLAVLLLAGVNPWVSAAVAAVFGLSASLIFLRRQRESIASDLYAARHRETPVVRADDEEEDAAVDATSRDRDADADADKSAG